MPLPPLSRRRFLSALGAAAGSTLVPLGRSRAVADGTALTGSRSLMAALHVHGSWSEGVASWATQVEQARALGLDVLVMTDHDYRALAHRYLPSLRSARLVVLGTGRALSRTAARVGTALQLRVESARSTPATAGLQVEPRPMALNRLRTSIAGTVLQVTFGGCNLPAGAAFEVVVGLSLHPAHGTRPTGELTLRYRFGESEAGSALEQQGLVGVVRLPVPAPGSVVPLDLPADVLRLWPDVLEIDNVLASLSLLATSPRRGVLADVVVQDLAIVRGARDAASVARDQRRVADTYRARYPDLAVHVGTEVSQQDPHLNVLGVPQVLPDQATTTPQRYAETYARLVREVHAAGGLVTYNHPFGASGGRVGTPEAQAERRRAVFAEMAASDLFGTQALEVAYMVRGSVGLDAHLALWDTFSRRGRFLTGTGVNDDHHGRSWATLGNGYATGLWAPSTAEADVVRALATGRSYVRHPGRWPHGEIDLLVDEHVPMGGISVSSAGSRSLTVSVSGAPRGAVVEVVQGLVDGAGDDPVTAVVDRLSGEALGTAGLALRGLDTSTSTFVRLQVRNADGVIVGLSNPVWLLRDVPATGIPVGRQA